jgi:hypothetical protein
MDAWHVPEYIDPTGGGLPPRRDPWPISRDFCESENIDPETLMLWQQPDDSMRYTVRRAGIVLIDTADVVPRDGQCYLLQHKSGARVRRVFVHHDGALQLSPDTTDAVYRVEIVPRAVVPSLSIIGRVRVTIGFT